MSPLALYQIKISVAHVLTSSLYLMNLETIRIISWLSIDTLLTRPQFYKMQCEEVRPFEHHFESSPTDFGMV